MSYGVLLQAFLKLFLFFFNKWVRYLNFSTKYFLLRFGRALGIHKVHVIVILYSTFVIPQLVFWDLIVLPYRNFDGNTTYIK